MPEGRAVHNFDSGDNAMADRLTPRTALDRGPVEKPIMLDRQDPEYLSEAGGDTAATDIDSNIGGAPASAGLDSGGAVGVRRGRSVGRPGFEYDSTIRGETPGEAGTSTEEAAAAEAVGEAGAGEAEADEGSPGFPG